MQVVGITGPIGAGKDTVSQYLQDTYGFRTFGMGDVIRRIAEEKSTEPTRENLQEIGKECRRDEGDDFLARKAAEEMKKSGGEKFVLNGIRNPEEVEAMRDEFDGDFILLHVSADEDVRFNRLKERGRHGDPETFEEFKRQDETEIEKFNMEEVFEMAEYKLDNNLGFDELYRKVDRFAESLNL